MKISKELPSVMKKYWLLLFFTASIIYLELIYRLWDFRSMSFDFIFPILFAFSIGTILYLLSSLLKEKPNKVIAILLMLFITVIYGVQLVYHRIFHTPLSIYSIGGAGDVMQFKGIILTALLKNLIGLILTLAPLIVLLVIKGKFEFYRIKRPSLYYILIFLVAGYILPLICVNLTDKNAVSQRTLYYNTSAPELSVIKLGLFTTMRLDVKRLIFGFEQKDFTDDSAYNDTNDETTDVFNPEENNTVTPTPTPEVTPTIEYNVMSIDFDSLIANEKDETLLDMDKYFASVEPTAKNEYTGMFKGHNLILITAESFSPYAIDPELTPMLYKMATEGFVFKNFYNPVWGVSTSDGEYVACTGLIPKSGVWSFAKSAVNWLPFVMGNQFKALGYGTRAYHDHTYTYYKRDISHPNMGYDFKAVGNGLELKKTWPESDVEMIDKTAEDYIGKGPFHTYYMSVSGHMNYNFSGNYMAYKNKSYVENLPYSEPAKAYIAANLEFEFAMEDLVKRLEEAGIADNTVIAISPDHYPYGLPREALDELAGHKVEDNFELYKSTLIIWEEGMKTVVVDKPCSSLDINPTLSNLFGLNYDSRLLMGRDILSDSSPLVIFSNRSWITDKVWYNSVTNTADYKDESLKDTKYVSQINKEVAKKFKYSTKILEQDYYDKIIPRPGS